MATKTLALNQTIEQAIAACVAGDILNIPAGTYNEGLRLTKSLSILAQGTVILTPKIPGTGTAINITNQNNCTVKGIKFKDFGAGFWLSGNDLLIENCEIDGLILVSSAEDYGNVFGDRITIRHCYFHGVRIPQDLGIGPNFKHNDALQFWNNNGEVLHGLLIEENIFTDFVQGVFLANETGVLSSMGNIAIRNNVFWGTNFIQSGNLLGKPSHGLFVGKASILGVEITNNLFYNCMNSISLYNMPASTFVQANTIVNYNTAYALSQSQQPNRGTGNLLWTTIQGTWEGSIASLAPDKKADPQLGTTLLGISKDPWGLDAGWRARSAAASGYGPVITSSPTPVPVPVPIPPPPTPEPIPTPAMLWERVRRYNADGTYAGLSWAYVTNQLTKPTTKPY